MVLSLDSGSSFSVS